MKINLTLLFLFIMGIGGLFGMCYYYPPLARLLAIVIMFGGIIGFYASLFPKR